MPAPVPAVTNHAVGGYNPPLPGPAAAAVTLPVHPVRLDCMTTAKTKMFVLVAE